MSINKEIKKYGKFSDFPDNLYQKADNQNQTDYTSFIRIMLKPD